MIATRRNLESDSIRVNSVPTSNQTSKLESKGKSLRSPASFALWRRGLRGLEAARGGQLRGEPGELAVRGPCFVLYFGQQLAGDLQPDFDLGI